jgi:gas vesicle protein
MCKMRGKNILLIILGALWGIGFGLFMSRKPGKELRKEIYDKWENGESIPKAKWDVFFRELIHAFRSVPEAIDEFLATDKMQDYKKKGEKLVEKGKKEFDKKVHEGKKMLEGKVKDVKKIAKKKVADIKKNSNF